jgi:hypothetical protein
LKKPRGFSQMSRQSPGKSENIPENLGETVLTALTQPEVALLLDALFESLSSSLLETALNRLPSDTRKTLQQILTPSPPTAVKAEKPASLAKLEQTWSQLWGQWHDIVSEATDEEGKYIEQEAHWEPPYFNDSALVEDLEALAEQMLPLLPTAYEHEFSPKADFAQTLEEMAAEIEDALPEWIQSVNEGFYLESSLTTCLLQWQWLQAQDEGLDAFGFTQGMRVWEERGKQVKLEQSAFFQFFTQLSDSDLQEIYQGLTAHRQALLWKTYLENTRSHWHELYLYCLERYAPERRLETLRATISQQWQNGLPVIEDLLAKEAYQESLAVVEKTLQSLLQSTRRDRIWSPETSLLVTLPGVFYSGGPSEDQITLLRYYQQAAAGLHQSERVRALELQLTACEHRFNWSVMLAAFRQESVSEATRSNLYQSWRDYIIRLTERQFWEWRQEQGDSSWWLPWLLDSVADSQKGTEEFQRRIGQWLADFERDEKPCRQDFAALRLLTCDLAEIRGENWHRSPNFQSVVLVPGSLKTPDAQSRQSSLKQLAPPDLWNGVMAYWQNHLDHWIPQPETARKSDYTEQAKWVAALRELSPTAYKHLLAQWRVQHKQRRNLWKALEQMGLS